VTEGNGKEPDSKTEHEGALRPVKLVDLAALIPFERNARIHSEEQIQQIIASIKEFGWTNPILTDGDKGILAGHGRFEAAKRLGLGQVPCIDLSGLTPAQKRAYVIADNKLALNAGWDETLLKMELMSLEDAGFDFSVTGFEQFEINNLLDTAAQQPESFWGGMPQFTSKDGAWRSIIIHFRNQEALDDFARLIGQTVSPKARFLWHPPEEKILIAKNKRYVSDAENPEETTEQAAEGQAAPDANQAARQAGMPDLANLNE